MGRSILIWLLAVSRATLPDRATPARSELESKSVVRPLTLSATDRSPAASLAMGPLISAASDPTLDVDWERSAGLMPSDAIGIGPKGLKIGSLALSRA